MLLKFIVSLLLVSSASAEELRVMGRHRSYRLNWDEKQISYEAPSAKLKFERKTCNAHIFEMFANNMKYVELVPKIRGGNPNMEYIFNGKTEKIHEKSNTGIGLLKLPEEIRRMKIEEALACKTTK